LRGEKLNKMMGYYIYKRDFEELKKEEKHGGAALINYSSKNDCYKNKII
jgi:hypothetical protein